MTVWSKAELRKIADTDEMHVSPLRDDGVSYATPTLIWGVVVEDAVYVRAYNGQRSRWYQAREAADGRAGHCRRPHEGRLLRAGGRSPQRPYRRRLPYEVPEQPIPRGDDQHARSLRDGSGSAIPEQNRMTPDRREKRHEQRRTRQCGPTAPW